MAVIKDVFESASGSTGGRRPTAAVAGRRLQTAYRNVERYRSEFAPARHIDVLRTAVRQQSRPVRITRPSPPVQPGRRPTAVRHTPPVATPAASNRKKAVQPSSTTAKRRLITAGEYLLIAVAAVTAAHSVVIGQWLVALYAALTIIWRISSRTTFAAGLFVMATIPLFTLIKQPGISQNSAVYTYELLAIGTLQATWELLHAERKQKHNI